MKKKHYLISFVVVYSLLFSACRKDCKDSEYTHYYPNQKMTSDFSFFLKKGNWWVYEDQNGVTRDSIVVVSDGEDYGENVASNIKPCIYTHATRSIINWYSNNNLNTYEFSMSISGGEHIQLLSTPYSESPKSKEFRYYYYTENGLYKNYESDNFYVNRINITLNNITYLNVLDFMSKDYLNGYSNLPTSEISWFLKEKQGFTGWIKDNDTLTLKNSFVQ